MSYADKAAEEERALDEAEAILGEALDKARTRLRAVGFGDHAPPEEGDFSCTQCGCEHFQRPASSGLKCRRPGCGHSFFRHRVF